jgi:hypothetical protein
MGKSTNRTNTVYNRRVGSRCIRRRTWNDSAAGGQNGFAKNYKGLRTAAERPAIWRKHAPLWPGVVGESDECHCGRSLTRPFSPAASVIKHQPRHRPGTVKSTNNGSRCVATSRLRRGRGIDFVLAVRSVRRKIRA